MAVNYRKFRNRVACGCIVAVPVVCALILVALEVVGKFLPSAKAGELGLAGAGIFFALFLLPLVFVVLGMVVGWLWAPFAALICGRVARAKGLERRRYARAGALYSVLFFWPWVYLILQMRGKAVPSFLVRGMYILLYAVIWPLVSLAFLIVAVYPDFRIVALLSVLGSVVTWIVTLILFTRWLDEDAPAMVDASADVLPHRNYIMPFALTFAWLMVFLLLQGTALIIKD